jgi:hypothetical protein
MQISYHKVKIFLVLLFPLLAIFTTRVKADESTQPVKMAVTPAYQGYFKYGEWLPVWVMLENNGPDLEANIQVKVVRDIDQTIFEVPVSLPSGALKRIPVYVLPNNFTHELKIELTTADETLLAETATVHPQPNINYLIGVIANQSGALSLIPGINLPGGRLPVLVDVSLEDLPDRMEGLYSLDSIIYNDIDTSSLKPDQVRALIDWVNHGGRLVLGGGSGAFQTIAGFPSDILPFLPTDLFELNHVDGLATFADTSPIRVPGPFIIATGETQQGQTLVEQDGYPLIQEIKLGDGTITSISLDVNSSPFDAWVGTTAFWEAILSPGAAYPNWMPPDMSNRQIIAGPIGNSLSNIPSLDLPSARSIVILLGIYILFVGPVNYLVLRRRQKLQWAWVTIPIITVIFSALSFGIGYAKRGTDLIINKIAIIQASSDSSAQVSSYIGLFSPANQSYEIEVEGDNLLSPMSNFYDPWSSSIAQGGNTNNLTFVQSNPSLVRGLIVNQWSMQSFMTEISVHDIGQIKSNLHLHNQRLVGTITNQTGFDLKDVVVILKPNFVKLGNLLAGGTTDVDLSLSPGEMYGSSMSWKIFESEYDPTMMGTPSREQEFKRMVLEAVIDQQNYYGQRFSPGEIQSALDLPTSIEATLVGWMDEAPPTVRINGEESQETATALYITELPFKVPENGNIAIPPGLIPGLVADMPFSGGSCGAENTSIWIERGEAILEFILPPEFLDTNIDSLQFLIQTDSGWGTIPEIAVYDWNSADWVSIEQPIIGLNGISKPDLYIYDNGLVRFKISIDNQDSRGGSCYFLGLGLEGSL